MIPGLHGVVVGQYGSHLVSDQKKLIFQEMDQQLLSVV